MASASFYIAQHAKQGLRNTHDIADNLPPRNITKIPHFPHISTSQAISIQSLTRCRHKDTSPVTETSRTKKASRIASLLCSRITQASSPHLPLLTIRHIEAGVHTLHFRRNKTFQAISIQLLTSRHKDKSPVSENKDKKGITSFLHSRITQARTPQ